jgi:pSer/pThr/pTyr-binding forkhead associated (FHA) protein
MAYRLRYLAHDFELPAGEFIVGRSAECQLAVDDPLVSRKHAVLRVTPTGVTVSDLGSRNGVVVNGNKIDGPHELGDGDKIGIGSQEMTLHRLDEHRPSARERVDQDYRRATQTLGAVNVGDLRAVMDSPAAGGPPSGKPAEVSRGVNTFRLLGGVADKALAMGRTEEAERILQALLLEIRKRAEDGVGVDAEVAEYAARYAARLAGATAKGAWVDYVFDLYAMLKRPLPAPVVDELYTVVRKVKSLDLPRLRSYLGVLRDLAPTFGPAERFLMQRIEGLERLGALK